MFQVTDAVHAKGSYIFAQIWSIGRAAKQGYMQKQGLDFVGASDMSMDDHSATRPLSREGKLVGYARFRVEEVLTELFQRSNTTSNYMFEPPRMPSNGPVSME